MPQTFNHEAALRSIQDKGLTIAFVAREIGKDRTVLSNILNGNRKGSVDLAVAIAGVTGDNPYAFLGPNDPRAAVIDLARKMGITAADLEGAA